MVHFDTITRQSRFRRFPETAQVRRRTGNGRRRPPLDGGDQGRRDLRDPGGGRGADGGGRGADKE